MRLAAFLVLSLALAAPARAQETDPPGTTLHGLLDDMLGMVNPWLSDLAEMLGDLSGWHTPEVLPNGDILIRRRRPEDAPEDQEDAPLEPGETLEL
ncbi:MAG: hypothetical protein KDK12_17860 [Rhodobacteraceae bacterium]|nr:hypothetical protein [Paracoccaceae bacterium]